ncbi:MAG: DNA mismatch repair endonuclease MutL, partial [Candidatus Rokuibacteriota bacterium]
MTRIRRLPDHLVNKIAAGEVVERPASVVKELVENAIDADGATITVDLKDAGRQLIRVSDDGIGMAPDEVDLALTRHATSKLATDSDLEAIATLGFRGEALPAICAVTRFSVLSCERGSETGTLVRGEGGAVAEKLLVAASPGTLVEAQDLFFNTPARLKFLKSAQAELAQALRLVQAIALAHPAIHFRLTHNGKPVLNAPRAGTLRDRLGAILGFEQASKMLEVRGTLSGVTVSGLIAPPQLSRGNRDAITLIVNGRPVRDTLLTQAL